MSFGLDGTPIQCANSWSLINGATTATTATFTPTANNDVIVLYLTYETNNRSPGGFAHVTGVTNSGTGLTWNLRSRQTVPNAFASGWYTACEVWWAHQATAAALTITPTFNQAIDNCAYTVFAVSGADYTNPWDTSATLPQWNACAPGSTTWQSYPTGTFPQGYITTRNANTMLLAFAVSGTSSSFSSGMLASPWTNLSTANEDAGTEYNYGGAWYQTVTSAQTNLQVLGTSFTSTWGLMLDAIVEASPSPAAQPNLVIDGYSLESLATVGSSTTTLYLSTASNAENLIVLMSIAEGGATSRFISSISDSGGANLSWTKLELLNLPNATGNNLEVWYALNTSGSALSNDPIVITYNGGLDGSAVIAFGVYGANTATPFDATNTPVTNSGSTGVVTSGAAVSTSNAYSNEMAVFAGGVNYYELSFSDTGWTGDWTDLGQVSTYIGSGGCAIGACFQVFSTAQTNLTVGNSTNTGHPWGSIAFGINAKASGVTGTWASTEADDTFNGSGPPFGTWASTEAKDTFAATGVSVQPIVIDGSGYGGGGYYVTFNNFTISLTTTNPDDWIVVAVENSSDVVNSVSSITSPGLTFQRYTRTLDQYYQIGLEIWYAWAPTAGTRTITVNLTSAILAGGLAFGVTNADPTYPFDVNFSLPNFQSGGGYGGSLTTNPLSTTAANAMLIAVGSGYATNPSTFTNIAGGLTWTTIDSFVYGYSGVGAGYAIVASPSTGIQVECTESNLLISLAFVPVGSGAPRNFYIDASTNFSAGGAHIEECTIATTADNTLLVLGVNINNGETVTGITDTASLTWTLQKQYTYEGVYDLEIWTAPMPTAGVETVTVTFGRVVQVASYTLLAIAGYNQTTPLDTNASVPGVNEGTSGDPTSASISTNSSVDCLVALVGTSNYASQITGVSSGWSLGATTPGYVSSGGDYSATAFGYEFVSTLQSGVTTAFTPSVSSADWAVISIAVQGPTAAVPAFGTWVSTEADDTAHGAPAYAPYDGIGWMGWLPGQALWNSTEAKDTMAVTGYPQMIGTWRSTEFDDTFTAMGAVPAFGTWVSTEADDTAHGAPAYAPYDGIGWMGWLPGQALWNSTDIQDTCTGSPNYAPWYGIGWLGHVPMRGTWASTEAKDRWEAGPFGKWISTEATDTMASRGHLPMTGLAIDGYATGGAGGRAIMSGSVTLSTAFPDDIICVAVVSTGFYNYAAISSLTDTAGLTWHRRQQRSSSAMDLYDFELWWAHAPHALTNDVITAHVTNGFTWPDGAPGTGTGAISLIAWGVCGANWPAPWDTNTLAGYFIDQTNVLFPEMTQQYVSAPNSFLIALHANIFANQDSGLVSPSPPYNYMEQVFQQEEIGYGDFLSFAYAIATTPLFGNEVTFGNINESGYASAAGVMVDAIVAGIVGQMRTQEIEDICEVVNYPMTVSGTWNSVEATDKWVFSIPIIWPTPIPYGTTEPVYWFADGGAAETLLVLSPNVTTEAHPMSYSSFNGELMVLVYVMIQSASGEGEVVSISEELGGLWSPGFERRSRVVQGNLSLELWWGYFPEAVNSTTYGNSFEGDNITLNLSGTTTGDVVSAIMWGIGGTSGSFVPSGPNVFWDPSTTLPATNSSASDSPGPNITGMSTVIPHNLMVAFTGNVTEPSIWYTLPFVTLIQMIQTGTVQIVAPVMSLLGGGPPNYLNAEFMYQDAPATDVTAEFLTDPEPAGWLMLGDSIPVGPPNPFGTWVSTEGVDIFSHTPPYTEDYGGAPGWSGWVPAHATWVSTEHTDECTGAPAFTPYDSIGWFGVVPVFCTWDSVETEDHTAFDVWFLGFGKITGQIVAHEAADRFGASNRTTVTGSWESIEPPDRWASNGYLVPLRGRVPRLHKRRLLIIP